MYVPAAKSSFSSARSCSGRCFNAHCASANSKMLVVARRCAENEKKKG
jgi:hypothetical protein